MTGPALATAAEALVGTPFRLHGRDPRQGLDCIGLFAAAMAQIGRAVAVPTGYPLKVRDLQGWLPQLEAVGLQPARGTPRPGDVFLLCPGPAQFHLAIAASTGGWIHAHAGLRRVVLDPAMPAGRIVHHWRPAPQN